MRKIFLYGPPASGKTTLGKALAEALGYRFADTDEMVVMATGCNISNLFATEGEAYFRDRESEALARACALEGDWVVALGGGTLLRAENRALAEKSGTVICLEAPGEQALAERIAAGGTSARRLGRDRSATKPRSARPTMQASRCGWRATSTWTAPRSSWARASPAPSSRTSIS